ncbi:MAG: hypothetical protein PVF58_06985 [Candidatus Methanofastidiosia archaeon]|jgi:hypothetical protein
MGYKALYIWVEGDTDFRFFTSVIKPLFEDKYDYVKMIKYGKTKKEKINNYLGSIISMGYEYIFVGDINDYSNKKRKNKN